MVFCFVLFLEKIEPEELNFFSPQFHYIIDFAEIFWGRGGAAGDLNQILTIW